MNSILLKVVFQVILSIVAFLCCPLVLGVHTFIQFLTSVAIPLQPVLSQQYLITSQAIREILDEIRHSELRTHTRRWSSPPNHGKKTYYGTPKRDWCCWLMGCSRKGCNKTCSEKHWNKLQLKDPGGKLSSYLVPRLLDLLSIKSIRLYPNRLGETSYSTLTGATPKAYATSLAVLRY